MNSNIFRSVEQINIANLINTYVNGNTPETEGPLLLESSPGVGKTRAFTIPAFAAAERGKKVVIAFPSWSLIEQFLRSSDLAVARELHPNLSVEVYYPSRDFDDREKYGEHATRAREADVMLCTSAAVIIDIVLRGNYCGAIHRPVRIFDEADQLPDMASLMNDRQIDEATLKDLGIKPGTLEETLLQVIASEEAGKETKRIAKDILKASKDDKWWHETGFDSRGAAKLYNKLPGRMLSKTSNKTGTVFVSATLSTSHDSFDDFKKAMGIKVSSPSSRIIEPRKHGELTFYVARDLKAEEPGWEEFCVGIINKAKAPTLVVTPSFSLAERLGARCPGATVRRRGEKTPDAVKRMQAEGKNILIAAAAWAGLDTPVQWKSIIVPQVPFGSPTLIDGEYVSRYYESRVAAIRRLRQVIGRGTRDTHSTCDIFILDARYAYDGIPAFVPKRFKIAWEEKIAIDGVVQNATFDRFVDPDAGKVAA